MQTIIVVSYNVFQKTRTLDYTADDKKLGVT